MSTNVWLISMVGCYFLGMFVKGRMIKGKIKQRMRSVVNKDILEKCVKRAAEEKQDIFKTVASEVMKIPVEEVTPEQAMLMRMETLGFIVSNGGGKFKL